MWKFKITQISMRKNLIYSPEQHPQAVQRVSQKLMRSFHARFTSTRRDVCKMESAKFAFCSRGRSEVLDYVTLFKLSLGSTLASSRYFFSLFKPFYLRSCVPLWGNAGELLSLTSHLLELKN